MDKTKSFAISKQAVWQAYLKVRANAGSAGVDGQSLEQFEQDLQGNLYKLWNRLSSLVPGEDVVLIERLRFADGEPMGLEISRLPLRYRPALELGDLERSVHDLLRASGVSINSLVRQVGAGAAPPRATRLLDLPEQALWQHIMPSKQHRGVQAAGREGCRERCGVVLSGGEDRDVGAVREGQACDLRGGRVPVGTRHACWCHLPIAVLSGGRRDDQGEGQRRGAVGDDREKADGRPSCCGGDLSLHDE